MCSVCGCYTIKDLWIFEVLRTFFFFHFCLVCFLLMYTQKKKHKCKTIEQIRWYFRKCGKSECIFPIRGRDKKQTVCVFLPLQYSVVVSLNSLETDSLSVKIYCFWSFFYLNYGQHLWKIRNGMDCRVCVCVVFVPKFTFY